MSIALKSALLKSLKEQFYVTVPFLIKQQVIDDAVGAFFEFLKEPEEIKSYIQFSVNPESRRGDVGFTHRNPKDDLYNDSKDYFHFHAAILERYPEFLKKHPIVNNFVQKALPIWKDAKNVGQKALSHFEEECPGICSQFFDSKEPEVLLRFLSYHWQGSGKYLAKPHYDAGSCTLAIAESDPGLRIGSCDKDLTPVQHAENEAIFMLGKNFPKIVGEHYQSSWHDVVQLDKEKIGQPCARWAVVCFFEAKGMMADPREETGRSS